MICKWCGAEISQKEKQCHRCGRETPALSDCGGFYDLVPQATRPAVVTQPTAARRKKKASPFAAVLCVLLAVALVVSVLVGLRTDGQRKELEDRLEKAESRGETDSSGGKTEMPDRQEIVVTVSAEKNTVSAVCSYGAQMQMDYDLSSGKGEARSLQLELEEVAASLEMELDDGDGNLSVECTLDPEFGEEKNAFHLQSVFVTLEDGQKQDLMQASAEEPEETVPDGEKEADTPAETEGTLTLEGDVLSAEKNPWFAQEENTSTCKIPFVYLQTLLKDEQLKEDAPLELVFVRTSRQGGSFTFTISDLIVPEE